MTAVAAAVAAATVDSRPCGSIINAADTAARALKGLEAVEILQLRWNNEDDIANLTFGHTRTFDYIVASDCLFFEEFCDHFISVLHRVLSPRGTIYLMQPRRGGSMNRFISKAALLFNIEENEEYFAEVAIKRREQQLLEKNNFYNDDVHFPILLVLTHKK